MQRAVRRAGDALGWRHRLTRRRRVPGRSTDRPRVGPRTPVGSGEGGRGNGAPLAGRRSRRNHGGRGLTRQLAGQTVLVAASEERTEAIARRLRSAGASVVPFPTVRIDAAADPAKLDDALRTWPSYDWVVFTST